MSRVFSYCIAIRHPISKALALPVFKCIASTYTTESIRSMLARFKSKENFIFGNHAKHKLIVFDFSKVLINTCLFEINGETSTKYLDQSYKKLVENEETCTYKTVIHVCVAHLIRAIKIRLQQYYKLDKAKIHFGMRVAGRIIACKNSETLIYFLRMVKTMLTTEIATSSITKLMKEIEEKLSAFDLIKKVLGPIEEEAFFENNTEEEKIVSEN